MPPLFLDFSELLTSQLTTHPRVAAAIYTTMSEVQRIILANQNAARQANIRGSPGWLDVEYKNKITHTSPLQKLLHKLKNRSKSPNISSHSGRSVPI